MLGKSFKIYIILLFFPLSLFFISKETRNKIIGIFLILLFFPLSLIFLNINKK
jgi:hypothetical protein